MQSTPRLIVTPQQNEPLQIRATGLPPGPPITLRATLVDLIATGDRWESHATFFADTHGEIDLANQSPSEGSLQDLHPMGLFSRLALVRRMAFRRESLTGPTRITLTVEVAGQVVATESIEQISGLPA